MTGKPTILIAQPHLAPLIGLLEPDYEVLRLWEAGDEARIAEARAMVAAGEFAIPAELVDRMPQLGLIACFTVGYDGIDVAWAKERGIAVSHAHNVNDEDVADHAIGLILGQIRAIVSGDRKLRAGGWDKREKPFTRSLGGMKLGIVGLGSIGEAVATRAEAMRMRVAWWGPNPKPDTAWPRTGSLLQLAKDSEILVVAARALLWRRVRRLLIAALPLVVVAGLAVARWEGDLDMAQLRTQLAVGPDVGAEIAEEVLEN